MDRITKQSDGSYKWSCAIDIDYHQRSVHKGIWACAVITAFVLILYAVISAMNKTQSSDLWIPLLVIGVILAIALPLLYLQSTASDPHEQYVMTEAYVKSGYGKSSVFSNFKDANALEITAKYIEIIGPHTRDRIYVPAEDMDFIRQFILDRIPEDASIRYN